MALVSVQELRDSLEASTANLDRFTPDAIETALTEAQAWLDSVVHYDTEATFTEGSAKYVLARKFVRMAAVRGLEATPGATDYPTPAGAMLTGLQSENASFTFFTPSGALTGYDDLDRLAKQIGIKERPKISSVRMVRG